MFSIKSQIQTYFKFKFLYYSSVCVSLSLSTSGFPLALYPSSGELLSYSLWLLWLAGWRGAARRSELLRYRGAARREVP